MSTFPPINARKGSPSGPNGSPKQMDSTATSTGKGGIAASLKIKAAGTKNAPGLEKNVNLS